MSAMPARQPRLAPLPNRTKRLSRLAVVNARAVVTPIAKAVPLNIPKGRASNAKFAMIISYMIGFGLLALLIINTKAAQAAFEKHKMQSQLNQMIATKQNLTSQVAAAESTDNLVTAARTLGMVPAETPVFIRLSDQSVVGQPVPAKAPLVPFVPPTTQTPVKP